MKEPCVQHPPNAPLILIRQWQLVACGGNECAAALLSFFEYWHTVKLEARAQAEAVNDSKRQHGDLEDQYTGLLQHHTEQELEAGIMLFKRKTIRKALPLLYKLKFISLHSNPYYKSDRTKWFLFHPEKANQWIKKHPAKMPDGSEPSPASRRNNGPSGKSAGPSSKKAGWHGKSAGSSGKNASPSGHNAVSSMHETTSETTSENRQRRAVRAVSAAGGQSHASQKTKRAQKRAGGHAEAIGKPTRKQQNAPAIKILRRVFNFRVCPDAEQCDGIIAAVREVEQQLGSDETLNIWRTVLEEWRFNKSSPVNYSGQLRKFAERIAFTTRAATTTPGGSYADKQTNKPGGAVSANVARFAEAEFIATGD